MDIVLDDPDQEPAPTGRVINGDLAPKDMNPGASGVQLGYDDLGNVITTDKAEPDREDRLYDSAGNDEINALGGNDMIDARRGGNDRLDGGNGDDIIFSRAGDDIVIGGAGSDILYGESGNDHIFAESEVSLSDAFAQQDVPPSGKRGEFITAGTGNDVIVGGAGNDALNGGTGNDLIIGGAGDDNILGDRDFNWAWHDWNITRTVRVQDGSTIYESLYEQALYSEENEGGHDIIYAGGGADWVSAGRGDDFIDGGSGDDVIFGEEGHDSLLGGDGDDLLSGDSASVAVEEQGNDYIDGGIGNDTLFGSGGNDVLIGGEGDDILWGEDDDDVLEGGADDDKLSGDGGNDSLHGGTGNDKLWGGDDDDVLEGGAGNDELYGGSGHDVMSGGADDDKLSGSGGNDSLDGGTGNDSLWGGDDDDTLNGRDGDDKLYGGDGQDVIFGGANADLLLGDGGNDTLYGDSGNDQLQGGEGNDVLFGGDDNDVLFGQDGDDVLYGGEGQDQLLGGRGNDHLSGGEGNDIYYFTLGEGVDHISDSGGYDGLVITNAYLFNVARLDVGSMAIVFDDGSELHIDDFDPNNPHASSIEYIQFADGTVVTPAQLVDTFGFQVEGTPEADVLSGTSLGETINAYGSDDVVIARAGNDVVDLGDGNDLADGGDGNDLVMGGNGDDAIFGGNGADTLHGGSGGDQLYGDADNDHLYGDDGDDLLSGGAGNDFLEGGVGNDTYMFGMGDGEDVAIDGNGTEQVVLTNGLTKADVAFQRQDDDLVISIKGTQDQLTVRDWFTTGGSTWSVGLGDGTILDKAAVEELLVSNQAPLTQPDAAALTESTATPVMLNVLANDSDPEANPLQVTNPGTYVGDYGTLTLQADGSASYVLNTGSPEVEGMMAGQTYTDTFEYTVTDNDPSGPQTSTSTVRFDIAGENDAPVAYVDDIAVTEDTVLASSGNALMNDQDADLGDMLRVANPGTYRGALGMLELAANGDFVYTLDNTEAQSLGRDQSIRERFTYTVADSSGALANAEIAVMVHGSNDAPALVAPLEDQSATPNKSFSWQMPSGSFVDPDDGDSLQYTASLADGSALPSWLSFDPSTQIFSGRAPRDATGYLDIQVTATDVVGGIAREDNLSSTDVFRLSFEASQGGGGNGGGNGGGSDANAGVGNGSDAPPPGHDYNFNDGSGTSPGEPGAKGGNGYQPQLLERPEEPVSAIESAHQIGSESHAVTPGQSKNNGNSATDRSMPPGHSLASDVDAHSASADVDPMIAAWFAGEQRTEGEDPFTTYAGIAESTAEAVDGLGHSNGVLQNWARVDRALRSHLLQSGEDALGHSPGLALGHIDGTGFLGSNLPTGNNGLSLKGEGASLKSFQGLKDGFTQAT